MKFLRIVYKITVSVLFFCYLYGLDLSPLAGPLSSLRTEERLAVKGPIFCSELSVKGPIFCSELSVKGPFFCSELSFKGPFFCSASSPLQGTSSTASCSHPLVSAFVVLRLSALLLSFSSRLRRISAEISTYVFDYLLHLIKIGLIKSKL